MCQLRNAGGMRGTGDMPCLISNTRFFHDPFLRTQGLYLAVDFVMLRFTVLTKTLPFLPL